MTSRAIDRSRWRRALPAGLLLGFTVGGGLWACRGAGPSAAAAKPGPQAPAVRAVRVRTAPVARRDVVYAVQALGSLEAEERVQVTAEVEGAVSDVSFHEGDSVGRERVLLRIDPERYRLEAERARANHAKAAAEESRAHQELERRERLFADQLLASEELNRARAEAERLAAEAAAARAARDIAEQNRARSEVRAPLPGVIDTRSVSTGEFVRPGTILATLVDTRRLRLRFKVSESESLRARQGTQVSFRVSAVGPQAFEARVYHVGEVADAATRQVEVLAWVRNPGVLRPGFFAEVQLATETHAGALVVPEGAVQASERGFVAYVVDGGVARQRPLSVGLRTQDGVVEVLAGLQVGETVVIEGSDRLAEGVPVADAGPLASGAAPAAPARQGRP